jgi:hypothetical protein
VPLQHTLIYEDEPGRIEIELAIEPSAAALQDVWTVLLQCMCGLFLNVQPRLQSQALNALRPIRADRSVASRSTISFRVMSLRSSISPTMKASCASRLEPRRQPCGRGIRSPILARAIQRIAVDIPTPNRAAACRADMPSLEAFKTRQRRSPLSALAIVHLFKVDVESADQACVTSQSIHRSPDML